VSGLPAITIAVLAAILLPACANQSRPAGSAHGTAAEAEGDVMTTAFEQAKTAFVRAAAQRTGLRTADLAVSPSAPNVVGIDEHRTGALWPFAATHGRVLVRGWAGGDGITVTGSDELAPLMRAAKVLEPAASLDALALATRIAWHLGPEYTLVVTQDDLNLGPPPPDFAAPSLTRRAPDHALVRFFLELIQARPGGKPDPRYVRAILNVRAEYATDLALEIL